MSQVVKFWKLRVIGWIICLSVDLLTEWSDLLCCIWMRSLLSLIMNWLNLKVRPDVIRGLLTVRCKVLSLKVLLLRSCMLLSVKVGSLLNHLR